MLEQMDLFGQIPERSEKRLPVKKKKAPPPQAAHGAIPVKKDSRRGRKSQNQMMKDAELVELPADEELFQKQYYTISEVAEMFHVNTSLLRFWENEFDILQPKKNKKGDRYFRPQDVKNLQLIYHLLRQRKYTIAGAKDYMKQNKNKAAQSFEMIQRLQVKAFLLQLKAEL
jgi:DNA-binding transcriptional MerR regulator